MNSNDCANCGLGILGSPATSTTTRVVLITELPVQQEPIEGTNDLIDSSKPLP